MEDSRISLREKAKVKMPNIPRGPHDYLVAVSSHRKTPDTLQPSDFMWFKCRARHTVAKIRTFYSQRTTCQVDLYSGSAIPDDTTQVAWLDHWGDSLVVFRAVENEQQALINAAQAPRTPLQPVNGHARSKPSDTPEKSSRFIVKADPDRVPLLPNPKIPTTDPSLQDPFGAPLNTTSLRPDQSILKNKLQLGQHIGGVTQDPQDYVPPALTTWPSPYSQVPHSISATLGVYPSNTHPSSSYIKQEQHRTMNGFSSVPPYQAPSGFSPTSDVAPPVAVQIPNASQNKRLAKLLVEASPEILEAEVQSSVILLDQLKIHLSGLPAQNSEAQQWLRQIETLRKQNTNEPTIIGVVGNTGAGKSSVINAMLDEERLVPTNCMRACTAVVTEMSWNSSDDENAKYRAEIEFIQPEDWEKELRVLFGELLDGSGNISREAYNEDSEAGVAYAKIKAVYPLKTKEDIANSSIRDLMREPAIRNVLGTTKSVAEARSDRFYRILQTFVDSKEKSTDDSKKQKKEMEYWPLIKVVKIYTKADALSTGAVVVDLPGVSDSNAARSAIANNYMKMCTGLWIVAPITRAVDDKAAKSLLGESFKRQLKYDGTYSRVTFICSKTDDISITEASDSLGLQDEMFSKWEKFDKIERDQKWVKKDLAELKESKALFGEVLSDTDDQLEVWDKLRDDLEDGITVYTPAQGSKKRKVSHKSSAQRKKRSSERISDDEDFISDDASSQEEPQTYTTSRGEPLTSDTVESKIVELKSTKKEARLQRQELDAQILNLREELKGLDSAHDEIEAEMSTVCISGRNQYSKGAIQQDFAAGIKELDQENQAEANEADFNPDEDLRDYAEVARSLPVFCVSSRAYQKLSGRLQRDKGVPGFSTVEETEIPQLQAHCKKLTEAGRASTCRRFLNALSQLVNSLSLWASNDGSGVHLSDSQRATEGQFLHAKLAELEKGLEKTVQGCLEEMKETLSENIYEKFDQVIQAAVDEANATAAKWGAPVNRENRAAGGYFWSTYKAICRRDGVYSNAQGSHDFNLQLTEPIIKQLGSDWEKAFARRLPHVLQSFTKRTKSLLQSFHQDVQARAVKTGTGIAGLAMLGQQLENYERIFQDLTSQMVTVIGERQRDANREFTPVIARRLLSAYQYCVAESGTGSYMRMKGHMTSHVDEHRQTMFRESTEEVKKHLKLMCGQVEEQMMNKVDEVFVLMRRDYMTVITGQHMPQGHVVPKWERSMKAEVAKLIQEREDAADKEENPDRGTSKTDLEETTDQALLSAPLKADPDRQATKNELDEAIPANDIEDAIQRTLNEEINAEFG